MCDDSTSIIMQATCKCRVGFRWRPVLSVTASSALRQHTLFVTLRASFLYSHFSLQPLKHPSVSDCYYGNHVNQPPVN